ncbi:MAG: dimethyl sulfoxide reductase anchor subunit [Myxococcales bacterium]|nr:dimethyl sulfoxide reductase anchor subunit [Myxococcales bacterium]
MSRSAPRHGYPKSEWELSLVFFTLIGQSAVGATTYLAISGLSERTPAASSAAPHLLLLLLLVLAQGISFFHLGRRRAAYRAIAGVSHSWLSREIASAGILALALGGTAFLLWRQAPSGLTLRVALGTEAASALLLLAAMTGVYLLPSRPMWMSLVTVLSFAGTANLLGLPIFLQLTGGEYTRAAVFNTGLTLLALALVQLWHIKRFRLWPRIVSTIKRESILSAEPLLFLLRVLLGIVLPLVLLLAGTRSQGILLAVLAMGELSGRMLFYSSSSPAGRFGTLYV